MRAIRLADPSRVPNTGAAGATRTKRRRGWSQAYQTQARLEPRVPSTGAAGGGCLIDSTRELSGTVFGLSAISVILRLVRRPYGLHAIPAIIQTHASHKARRPIARQTESATTRRGYDSTHLIAPRLGYTHLGDFCSIGAHLDLKHPRRGSRLHSQRSRATHFVRNHPNSVHLAAANTRKQEF
jgi:hypothetical protein